MGAGVLVRVILVYKSALGFCITAKLPKFITQPLQNCSKFSIFSNFASWWAAEECEGSKWGRISLGIEWTWSQTCHMCLTCVNTCLLITLLLGELQGSMRGQNGVESRQEFNRHGPRDMPCVHNMYTCMLIVAFSWATGECEGSNWGRISSGIHWRMTCVHHKLKCVHH